MNSQTNDLQSIEKEKHIVTELTGLNDVDFNNDGWDSRVYSVNNGQYFFKFPRSAKVKSRYKNEISVLKHLNSINLGVKTQSVVFEHPENDYFGYEGIIGTNLKESLDSLDLDTKQRIGATLGLFLKQLHNLEIPDIKLVSPNDEISQLNEWYLPARQELENIFTPQELKKLDTLVKQTWPSKLFALDNDSKLCHGDFHLNNVIYCPNGSLGIIDFGDVGYYDSSKDFIGFNDNSILNAALDLYGNNENLRSKIALRRDMFLIIKLTANLGKNDTAGVNRTIEILRSMI